MRTLFLLLVLIPLSATAQWTENFSDKNLNFNPVWTGDSTKFLINPSLQLQLNAPVEAASAYLATPSNVCFKSSWTFWIKMGFNPSSANYANVYLMSNNPDLTKPLDGYYLRIGGSNDDLCLFRQEGQVKTLIADGRDKMLNSDNVIARIKVTRDDQGNWAVYCDTTGNINFQIAAHGVDNTIVQSAYFGVHCVYSKTRSTSFYFDDLEVTGELYNDETLPLVGEIKILDAKRLSISFSETIDSISACDTKNYNLQNNALQNIIFNNDTRQSIELTFKDSFTCEYNNLFIRGISDVWGLPMKDTILIFRNCTPQLSDVVFNEIMADPTPSQGLPEAEYIELFNRSNKTFDLGGWKLTVGTKTYIFPQIKLSEHNYLLITAKENQLKFSSTANVLGLFTSSSTLINTGQYLRLDGPAGQLISWLEYSDTWYKDDFKVTGGWALEQIDPWNTCGGEINWIASKANTGGTPGSINSVYSVQPDTTIPYITRIQVMADTIIDLIFNEPMDSVLATDCKSYEISDPIGHPKYAKIEDNRFLSVRLYLRYPLISGQKYAITIARNIIDCAGNQISNDISILLGLTEKIQSGDVIINEVLFNAKAGGSDYVELYNRSDKILDSRQLLLGIKSNGNTANLTRLSETGFLINPADYLLITSNVGRVKPFYQIENDKNFIEISQMPSLDDKASTIILLNDTMGSIDEFAYSESMQLSTLKDIEGVSLERVNPDKPSNFPGNWHSAAETAGYGTPGYKNSQYLDYSETSHTISLVNEIFSPDNDGYNDILQVAYQFEMPGCRAQVIIFDIMGRRVRCLLNNELLGIQGVFTWDGTDDTGKLCTVGIYIIFLRTVSDDGTVKEYKKSCVLAVKR
jgi:hypothetical protein